MADADKNRVIVLAVVEGGLSVADAAARFNVSTRWVHALVARYREHGLAGLEPRSRAPRTSPQATPAPVRARILQLRDELSAEGLDAGAESIADRLAREDVAAPATSTIWRILRDGERVTAQPRKRPRSSWTRFEAAAPNGCWQSDMTHWHLTDGTGVEIISWLDDHSRFLLHISVHAVVTAPKVTHTFLATAREHGLPAATLTDNGLIYTTRFANYKGGPNHFEHVIASLGVVQKNGHPGHPQTQGKIERFHQTLKRWLAARPGAITLEDLQALLDAFRHIYNHDRPHRSLSRRTPAEAYTALPKDQPSLQLLERHWRVRHDIVDPGGTITVRWAGRLRHLAIGRAHKAASIVLLIAGRDTLVIDRTTGEIIAEHTLDQTRDYQPKKHQRPLPKEGPL
ncbi:IS481 family transposase [Demequina mangrovi]|uniref:Transposase InsO and inactivated derivatives n=1 Tax=Demequina mangrovi TaxID=1043493 RepID=A0A1H7B329_9MICO|nr:IS481 family transposase [Demequina mangrovi]SEJ72153.1 Transposase InsO and inactivated derivatives [Demequina mangrovi]